MTTSDESTTPDPTVVRDKGDVPEPLQQRPSGRQPGRSPRGPGRRSSSEDPQSDYRSTRRGDAHRIPSRHHWAYNLLMGGLGATYDIIDNVAFSAETTAERISEDPRLSSGAGYRDLPRSFVRALIRTPPVLEETDDAYIVEVDAPGVNPEDVLVEVRGRRVFVSADRRLGPDRMSSPSGRRRASVNLEWTIPPNGDDDQMEVTLSDGILTLSVSKFSGNGPPVRVIPVS
jgi:HSP20 family molecular chaperone IbpA